MDTVLVKKPSAFEKRIHEIDLLRGFLMILVIFDHLMWFINYYIFHYSSGFLTWYWTSDLRFVVRQIVLMLFMFTCGISCHFSRNNKKRGLLLLAITIFVFFVTHIIQITGLLGSRVVIIDFNILGVIALSILLYALCEKVSTKGLWCIVGLLMLFYFFTLVSERMNPSNEYDAFLFMLYAPFNPTKAGYVGDFLPLFPYVIFLFLGVIFARKVYQEKKSVFPKKGAWEKPICLLGRHTLIVYVVHEIILTGLFMLIGLAF